MRSVTHSMYRLLVACALALTLGACGGGSGHQDSPQELGSSAVLAKGVKLLSDNDAAAVVFADASTIDVPSSLSVDVDDIVVINDQAWRLGTPATSPPPTGANSLLASRRAVQDRKRFSVSRPVSIAGVVEDLVINGKFALDTPGVEFVPASELIAKPQKHKQILALPGSTKTECPATLMDGKAARKCSFEWTDSAGSPAAGRETRFKAEFTSVGLAATFQQWSAIRGAGSGDIRLPYKMSASFEVGKALNAFTPVDGDACYSGRTRFLGERIYVGAISIPLVIPGPPPVSVKLSLPLCITLNAKVDIAGKLLSIDDEGVFTIRLRGGQLPEIARTGSDMPKVADASDRWQFGIDENNLQLQLLSFEAKAELAMGVETGFEVGVFGVTSLGFNVGAAGSLNGTANFSVAAAQRFSADGGVPFAQWGSGNPSRFCLKANLDRQWQGTVFGTLPAFGFLFGNPSISKTVFTLLVPRPLFVNTACDLRVGSRVTTTSQATAVFNEEVELRAEIDWNPANADDPDIGLLWKNAPVTEGKVDFFANGSRLAGCQEVPVQPSGLKAIAVCKQRFIGSGAVTVDVSASFYGNEKTLRDTSSRGSTSIGSRLLVDGGPQRHWAATYRITPNNCTQLPVGVAKWFWQEPCHAYIGSSGASGRSYTAGAFYFADAFPSVIFEARSGFSSEQDIRSVKSLGWRSTQDRFSLAIQSAFLLETLLASPTGYLPRTISDGGSISYSFTVTARTATTLEGLFTITMRSGYFDEDNAYLGWNPRDTTASGTWRADLINAPMPNTQMKEFDYCTRNGYGARSASIPDPATNPDVLPGWSAPWVTGGCVFGS